MSIQAKGELVLAIHGGRPVREKILPYGHHCIDDEDIGAVVEVLRSDWITTGPKVDEFESAFAEYVRASHAVSFSSGTAGLHGAVFAAGLEAGDEAITSPMTFCATANCVLYQGARPVFADVCRDTLNVDPQEVARRITPRTKVILPVDYAGHPADLDPLLDLAERRDLVLIEDACHALGAEYKGRRVGSMSTMTVFSFHPVKHITTGEGGMVVTNNRRLAERLRIFRNHGIDNDARHREAEGRFYYEMIDLGRNYRLTDIGCALGLSQLRKIETNLARRREIAAQYTVAFQQMAPVTLPPVVRPDVDPAWHLYPVRFDISRLSSGRVEVLGALWAENIGATVHYIPVYWHPYYQRNGYSKGLCPVAEAEYTGLVSLPIFSAMTDQDVNDVVTAVEKVLSYYHG